MTSESEITSHITDLHEQCLTLHLATIGAEYSPDASYAPYAFIDGNYYVFVSQLAAHTKNLLAQKKASIMLVEAEDKAKNPFARKRFTCACDVKEIARTESLFGQVMGVKQARFGSIIELLSGLGDFHLMQLQPTNGRLVIGFGQAIELDIEQLRGLALI
jgi:heme iron utilization protein